MYLLGIQHGFQRLEKSVLPPLSGTLHPPPPTGISTAGLTAYMLVFSLNIKIVGNFCLNYASITNENMKKLRVLYL